MNLKCGLAQKNNCDYKALFQITKKKNQAILKHSTSGLMVIYVFYKITFHSTFKAKLSNKASCVQCIQTDFPPLGTFSERCASLLHEAAYNGVRCKNKSLTLNFCTVFYICLLAMQHTYSCIICIHLNVPQKQS